MMEKNDSLIEVIIVGGSYAGLSAAMALGRSLRKVLIIDSGEPCNKQTPHAHNFITHDGEAPAAISAKAKKQVLLYDTVKFVNGEVTAADFKDNLFIVYLASGEKYQAKKILFATGVRDIMPGIKGFSDCWGISVLHCPYCHGYEVKNQPTAVMGNGEGGFHTCMVLTQWTNNITLFTNGPSTLDAGQVEKLSKHKVHMIENEITELHHKKGYMSSIRLINGEEHDFKTMYARIPLEQHCKIPVALGCQLDEHGLIKTDELKKTCVPGVFAAGDNSTASRALSLAVAAGTVAGAGINGELVKDVF